MVLPPNIDVRRQEKKSRGLTIETVHRREGVQARGPLQTSQQRSLDVLSNRSHRHPVRLIDNKDVLVTMNDQRFLSRSRFRRNLLPVKDKNPVTVRRIFAHCRSIA